MDIKAYIATISSYFVSFGLWLGSSMHWLNENSAGIYALTAIITCASHLYYQHKNSKKGNKDE